MNSKKRTNYRSVTRYGPRTRYQRKRFNQSSSRPKKKEKKKIAKVKYLGEPVCRSLRLVESRTVFSLSRENAFVDRDVPFLQSDFSPTPVSPLRRVVFRQREGGVNRYQRVTSCLLSSNSESRLAHGSPLEVIPLSGGTSEFQPLSARALFSLALAKRQRKRF